jgi:benzoylformate decarboxylase
MPGLGNAMGMLYNSYRTRTPLVIYAGQHPQHGSSQEPILAGDLVRLAEPLTKWATEAQDAHEIPVLLRRAFKVAMDPPRGPVFVSIPSNLMDEDADVTIAPAPYLNARLAPDPDAIETIAKTLADARSPVVIAGSGVATSGATTELVQVAEAVGARVHASFTPELPYPTDHPLYAGLLNVISAPALRAQLSQADVILAVGTPLLPLLFPLEESPFPKDATVIHIDTDPWEIGKNWNVDIGLLADPRQALMALHSLLKRTMTPSQTSRASRRAAAVRATADQLMQALESAARARWDNVPIGVGRMMSDLADAMAPRTIFFDEAVTAGGYLMRYLRFSEPGSYFRASGGGLGPGMPNPIGIKLARPDRPVLSVVGDGAALYTIQSLWTASHHHIPVTWVIANNASYRILKLNMLDYLGEGAPGREFLAMDLTQPQPDFTRIAAGFGVKAVRVERPDDIGDAVREAQSANEPRLVDIAIDGDVRSRWL